MNILLILLSIICFIYGIIILLTNSGTLFFLIWFFIGVCFIALYVCDRLELLDKLSILVKRVLLGIICIGLLFFIFIEAKISTSFDEHGSKNLDYIIVLGAQVYEDRPSVVLQYRLDEAITYLQDNPDTMCIVTGGQGPNEPIAEGVGMHDYLIKNGIPEDRILVEDKSKTTIENIEFSKILMKDNASVGLITNNFHLHRALLIARKYGLPNVEGIAAGSTWVYLPNNMLREFLAMIKYYILG